ncbi:MAG: hypothetical protein AABY32_02070 [Nanoarchaeota archaeon]
MKAKELVEILNDHPKIKRFRDVLIKYPDVELFSIFYFDESDKYISPFEEIGMTCSLSKVPCLTKVAKVVSNDNEEHYHYEEIKTINRRKKYNKNYFNGSVINKEIEVLIVYEA